MPIGTAIYVGPVKKAAEFQEQMSGVKAISGATTEEIAQLSNKAKEMGASTKFTATEAGQAMEYMAMAGWKTEDMLGGIEGIMNLAAASGEDLAGVSDIVTDALTAFGLSASDAGHFSDVLAQASSNANTNVSMMGSTFQKVAPVAGALGYSVEDMSLGIGLMANASIKAEVAGTSLKTALANMAKPTDAQAAAMEKYGISLTNADGSMKSFGDVVKNLRSSLGGLSEAEQVAAATTIFGKESFAGMLAIVNASEADFNKLTDAVYNCDGAAKQMAETKLDNLNGSITLAQSAFDALQVELGELLLPTLAEGVKRFTEIVNAVTNFVRENPQATKTIGLNTKVEFPTSGDTYRNIAFKRLGAASGVTIPKLLIALGLYPDSGVTGYGNDQIWMRCHGERLPFRGSAFGTASDSGPSALILDSPRSLSAVVSAPLLLSNCKLNTEKLIGRAIARPL